MKIWRWYEDMKVQHLSLLRSGENLQSAVSLLQSFSICVCRVTEGWILQHSGSLGLYLYTAAGDIQYCDTIPFFHVPNTLISLIICHHDNKIRDNVSNFLWGLLKPEHMEKNIKIFYYCWLNWTLCHGFYICRYLICNIWIMGNLILWLIFEVTFSS